MHTRTLTETTKNKGGMEGAREGGIHGAVTREHAEVGSEGGVKRGREGGGMVVIVACFDVNCLLPPIWVMTGRTEAVRRGGRAGKEEREEEGGGEVGGGFHFFFVVVEEGGEEDGSTDV